eukprot:TRINITY_DN13124_c0_g1_i1.p1 TRINITY_DN13124_c0_g1~~TRINITY_DN13124_c0_g1_i1.p1  ORF type:complete len:192 (+),score=29.64 TRINITY_DN13124_c0_g1_i1:146-721(+)
MCIRDRVSTQSTGGNDCPMSLSDMQVGEVFSVLAIRMREQHYIPRPHEVDCLRNNQNRVWGLSGAAAVIAMAGTNEIGRRLNSVTRLTRVLFVAGAGVASAHTVGRQQGSHCVKSLLELPQSPLAREAALVLRQSRSPMEHELKDLCDQVLQNALDEVQARNVELVELPHSFLGLEGRGGLTEGSSGNAPP